MEQQYVFVENLTAEAVPPENGIVSRTLQNDARTKVILFGFAPGQELSAHTAPFPAMLQFVSGEGTVKLGAEERKFSGGSFVYMTANLEHGIQAKTALVVLLVMIKNNNGTASGSSGSIL